MKSFFISSTFKDMQAERDILHERIFPRLRTLLKSFGEDVQEVDLRWGVDTVNMTEEESGYEVLKICIDAIDRCKPYLVVLLGERYGWIPGMKLVDAARDTRISDHYEEEMSITELEIQYGALLNQEAFAKCVFCFRDPAVIGKIPETERDSYSVESTQHALRLAALKKQIRSKPGAVILEYTADWDGQTGTICGLDAFERELHAQLEQMILKDMAGKESKSLMERYVDEVELIKDGYLSTYIRRYPEEFLLGKHLYGALDEVALHSAVAFDCLLVSGDAGSGKSALMAYVASSLPKLNENAILCFAAASGCRNVALLKRFIAYRLETLLEEPHEEAPQSVDELLRKLNQQAQNRGIICFVDGLDQIYHGESTPYIDLPTLCPNVLWVFSALPDFPFGTAAADYSYETVLVDRLHPEQRSELIRATAGKRGKKLDAELVAQIAESTGAGNPLFLSLVLQRFFMMHKEEFEAAEALAPGMEGLHRYMLGLMQEMPDLPDRMAVYILDVTAKLFDQEQFQQVLMLIAEAQNGLTEKELEEILALDGKRFSQVKFQQIVSYLYDAFHQRSNGKWTFSHRLFGEAVQQTMTAEDRDRTRELLMRYSLENEEFMAQEGFRYLLDGHHPGFAKALENCESWPTKAEVKELVGNTAKADPACRDFLEDLARSHPSEGMAELWVAFDDFVYGDAVEKMVAQIIAVLLDAPISDSKKWRLALRRLHDVEKPEMLPLIRQAKQHAAALPEPACAIAMASVYAELARVLTGLIHPYDEILEARKQALTFVENAVKGLGGDGQWKDYVSVLDAVRLTAKNASSWDDPEAETLWLYGLQILEKLNRFADIQQDDYTWWKVHFLYRLCSTYCDRQTRDYEKAKLYGGQALELAEMATSQRPTVKNLENRINALKAYTRWMKLEYQNPYWQQAMECARKLYASAKTDQNKRILAANEAEYAVSYVKANRTGKVKLNLEKKAEAKEIFAHSSQLFEELAAADYSKSEMIACGTLMADWAMLCVDEMELDAALRHGDKSLQRLRDYRRDAWQRYEEESVSAHKEYIKQQVDWADGWIGRVQEALSRAHLLRCDGEACERCAQEALELTLERSKQYKAYYREALNSALKVAQGCYYQRKDDAALAACDRIDVLVAAPEAERYNCQKLKAETLYIRSRIALERGKTDAAWEYMCQCEQLAESQMLKDKLLILKADCLQAKGEPQAAIMNAWAVALRIWRKRVENEYEKFNRHCKPNSRNAPVPQWIENRLFAMQVYYFAYCYHHYVTDESRMREGYDQFERMLLYALTFADKGWLKNRKVLRMRAEEIPVPVCRDSDCTDFATFMEKLNAMTDWENASIDPAAQQVILDNIEKFSETVPDAAQYEVLDGITSIFYDQVRKERSQREWPGYRCRLMQKVLPVVGELPLYEIHPEMEGDRCDIWTEAYIRHLDNCWYAVMKLLLLILRREHGQNKKTVSRLRSVYRVVSEVMGGSEVAEETDLSFLTGRELEELLRAGEQEHDLRHRCRDINWYGTDNAWAAELFCRTGDRHYIEKRLRVFANFLAGPETEQYDQLDEATRADVVHGTLNGVAHLAKVLQSKDRETAALEVIRWCESIPELAGKLKSKTLYSLRPQTEEERRWLEDVKLRYCKKWMEKADGKRFCLRFD